MLEVMERPYVMRMKKFRLLVLVVTVAAAGAGRVGASDAPAEGS